MPPNPVTRAHLQMSLGHIRSGYSERVVVSGACGVVLGKNGIGFEQAWGGLLICID